MAWGYVSATGDITRITRAQHFKPMQQNAKLSVADVKTIAANIAHSRINPILSALGVTLPITQSASPSGWNVLERMNVLGAACEIDRISFTEVSPGGKQVDPWQCVSFEKQLELLQGGKIDLIDVTGAIEDELMAKLYLEEDDPYFAGLDDEF